MANLITIDQLLESVDLDFEPRFVTKDGNGDVYIFEDVPETYEQSKQWVTTVPASGLAGYEGLKVAEFENKSWQECFYEVPRNTTGKIEKLEMQEISRGGENMVLHIQKIPATAEEMHEKINELVDAVNELRGDKHPTSTPQAPHK